MHKPPIWLQEIALQMWKTGHF